MNVKMLKFHTERQAVTMAIFNRCIWIVLDSVGIGGAKDAARFNDEGTNTILHTSEYMNGLKIPNLVSLGLGNIDGIMGVDKSDAPIGAYARVHELSNGKDTTTGHWEMIGIESKLPFNVYPDGFSDEIIEKFLTESGLKKKGITKVLGNKPASGTEILKELGEEHLKTKEPIVYTSADSVFQIACNEAVYSNEELYDMCKAARKILVGKDSVARVIARPFIGNTKDGFERTPARRDFSLKPPANNLLVYMKEAGMNVAAVGKIEDIFAGVGITKAVHTKDNEDGMDKTLLYMDEVKDGLIFTNLVEFDSKWGHRRDPKGYGEGLEAFDVRLKEILDKMKEDDVLFINADHGCDPTYKGTDHTREDVMLLAYKKNMTPVNMGERFSFADIGQTISENFGLKALDTGESFLNYLM